MVEHPVNNKRIFIISGFGFFGAISRILSFYMLSELMRWESSLCTFLINIVGTLCFGFVLHSKWIAEHIQKDLLSGFFGSFTTFAIFELELHFFFTERELMIGILYILIYCMSSIIFYELGSYFGKKFNTIYYKCKNHNTITKLYGECGD